MRATTAASRFLGLGLLGLGLVWSGPGDAASPSPVEDPLGLVVPMPGCGMASPPMTLRLLHQVRAPWQARRQGGQPGRHLEHRQGRSAARPLARRPANPPVAPPPMADATGALAWRGLYGCVLTVPEEAGITAGARPLRPT